MTVFSRHAVQVQQGNLTLYLTYLTPRDLFTDNFLTVDTLEPTSQEGYQRILNETRANRLAKHLTEANHHGYAHLPTTVFLATGKSVDYDDATSTLSFETDLVCPFSIVDGQHRIEGLRLASNREDTLRSFRLPVTIATDLDFTHQMYHFFIVNTTQVPVDPALRQQITSRFTGMLGVDNLPYMPHWLEHEVASGRDAAALHIIEALNSSTSSPLFDRIRMANDTSPGNKINQSSLVSLFRTNLFVATNPLAVQETDPERQARIVLNYLMAADVLLVDGRERRETVLYKSNGLFFLFGISKWVFGAIYQTSRDFTVDSITNYLKRGFDNLGDMYQHVAEADWWMPGPHGATNLNRSASRILIDAFQRGLARSLQEDIKL